MITWEKLPAIDGSMSCITCGCGAKSDISMESIIGVGFGDAGYSKDGDVLWQEHPNDEEFPTVGMVEELAKNDPNHDWRIWYYAPLYEAEYQRQGDGIWVLVRKGKGFA